jgi:hypothetical protein
LFTGIKHEDILSELEKEILEDIKSIQMTEKSCIVTLKSEQAKYKILNSEMSLKNRSVNSREANVSFRNSSRKAKNIYARADNNNPPGVAHNRNRY